MRERRLDGIQLMRLMGEAVGDEMLLLAADIQELEGRVQDITMEYCGKDERPDVSAIKSLIEQANLMLDEIIEKEK